MIRTDRVVSFLALFACVALAMPAKGQSGSGGPGAWEKQLVLPAKISARLDWAQRRLQPSGLRRLEKMGRTLAPAIAAGNEFDPLREQAELGVIAAYPGLAAMDVSEAAFIVMAMATKDMDDDIRLIMAEIKAMTAAKQKLRELIKDLNAWISREMSKHSGSEDIDNDKAAPSRSPARVPASTAKPKVTAVRRMTFETRYSPVLHLEYVKISPVPPLPPRNSGLSVSALKSLRDDIKGKLDNLNEIAEMTSLRLQVTMDRRAKYLQTLSNIMKKASTTQETLVQNIK